MSKKKIICLSPNKTPPVRSRANRYAWLLASVAAFALNIPAHANPEDGVVSAGSATITTTVKNVDIHQSSNRAIIDWRSFDIAPDETTRFHQPGASATTLNRVTSANPSTVAGNLQANGNVILINPNGVFFSKTAHVDVNGLVATTANIDNSEFMAGSTTFNRPGNPNAAIVNEGRITAREAGLVGLVAPRVENSGTISARLGRVALSSGDTATVDLYGDGLVSVAVSDDVQHQLVRNSGTIAAEGGTVQISAAAGRQIVDSLIDVSGAIDTPTVATRRGRILIQADSNKTESTALVSGSLNAAGRHAGEKGGQIDVLADNVGILSGATLDASGQTGGGTVHVGGDYQGQGTLQRAQRSIVQAGSVIDVSAGEEGDGGRAIVWADQWTVFAGQILARGGRNSGNGGFVETSGKNILTATGIVDAAAPFGVAGLWLLDPNNITIQTTGSNTNITGNPDFTTSNNSAILTVGSIQTALNAGTSVSVTTASAGTNTQLGDITVANSITKSSGGNASLTLTANRSIILNTGVSISSTSGQMGVTLNADSDANGTGSITLNSASSILSNGGDIVLGGGANPLTTAARGYAGSVIGINLTAATLNAAGGNISLRGTGHAGTTNNYGILMQTGAKVMTSGAGTITMNGTGGVGTTGNRGIYLTGANTAVSSVDGAITLTGQGGGTTTTNEGIYLAAAATIAATGSGALTLTGHAGGTTVQGVYLNQTTAANTLMSAGGTVTLKSNQTIQLSKAHIASPTAQAFNIVLNADLDGNSSGRIALTTSNLLSSGGNITLGGGADPTTGSAVGVAGAVEGINLNASTLNAAGGNISLRGRGYAGTTNNYGILMQGAAKAQTAGAGTVSLTGTGGVGTTGNRGIYLTGAGTAVSSVNGAITLTGTGAGTSLGYGIDISSSASVASTGAASLTLTGIGGTGAVGIYNSTTAATIGGASHTGNITVTANNASWGSLVFQTTGNVAFRPYTASTTIGVAGGAGTLGITAALLANTTAGSVSIGRSDGTGLMTVNARTWTAPVSLYNGNANISLNGAQVMGARTFLARTYGTGDIAMAAASTITSTATGNAIILASGHNFINAGGTSPLTAASGRWLIYSTNPASDTLGGLTSGFRRFSCSYGGSCPSVPANGNGFLYSHTPLLTITPTALSAITYGDATPNLTDYAYTVGSGYLGGDSGTDVLTGALTGSTSYAPGANVGTYNLDYASGNLASAMGYGFTYANNASAFTVNKRVLTATLQNQTITYGTVTPTLNKASTSDVVWGNLYGSETGASLDSATFTYGGATPGSGNNAGSYTLELSGITATNYSLGAVTNGTLTINPYTLTVTANSLSKIVGTPDPILTYSYGALQNGDSAAIFTGSLTRTPGDAIAGSPYAITQGTLSVNSNYIMSFIAGQLTLTAAIPEGVARSTQPQLQFVTMETGSAVLTQLGPASINVQLDDPSLPGQPEATVAPAAGSEDSEEDDCASGSAAGSKNDSCR